MCRFFSDTFAPKSSHFYTPYATECGTLKEGKVWQYEAISFYLRLPDSSGKCIAGTQVLYRLYNNGMTGAPNHRYTANAGLFATMQASGWTAEGDGVTGAFACIPAPSALATGGRIETLGIRSSQSGYEYPISVYLPAPTMQRMPITQRSI